MNLLQILIGILAILVTMSLVHSFVSSYVGDVVDKATSALVQGDIQALKTQNQDAQTAIANLKNIHSDFTDLLPPANVKVSSTDVTLATASFAAGTSTIHNAAFVDYSLNFLCTTTATFPTSGTIPDVSFDVDLSGINFNGTKITNYFIYGSVPYTDGTVLPIYTSSITVQPSTSVVRVTFSTDAPSTLHKLTLNMRCATA